MEILKIVGVVVGLAVLASLIVFLSVMAASRDFNWDFDTIVDLAKTTGMTVLIGGSLVVILAVCFAYNKPDVDLLD